MIATMGTILVWLINGAVGVVGLICSFVGLSPRANKITTILLWG